MTKNLLRSQAGVSIIEVMIAAGIVTLTFYGMISLFTNYSKIVGRIGEDKAQYLAIANFRESVLADPALFQYVINEFEAEQRLAPDQLPWYLTNNEMVPKSQCEALKNCATYKARVGYVLYPHESKVTRNVYALKIRIYDVASNTARDFSYLVSPK